MGPADTTSSKAFCTRCGAGHRASDNFCSNCGLGLAPLPAPDTDHDATTPIGISNFLPRVLSALEDVSIRAFFLTAGATWRLLRFPFRYSTLVATGRVPSVFTTLVMATFAGTLKWSLDPVFKPIMGQLDVGYELTNSLLHLLLYVSLAMAFGFFALMLAHISYSLLPIRLGREAYVRAMLNVFNLLSFLECGTSPLWMPLVDRGIIPWGTAEAIRAFLILVYARLVYVGMVRHEKAHAG